MLFGKLNVDDGDDDDDDGKSSTWVHIFFCVLAFQISLGNTVLSRNQKESILGL